MDHRMLNSAGTRLNSTVSARGAGGECDRMDTLMCQSTTFRAVCARFTALLLLAGALTAQTPAWRRIGGPSVELLLASPATGPVSRVWFSADGLKLYAQTAGGRIFMTPDLDTWEPAETDVAPP